MIVELVIMPMNMIPISENSYKYIDTNSICLTFTEQKYQNLLRDQLRWLNREGQSLREKAINLYNKRIHNLLNENVASRCCDFKLLEEKCLEYNR